MFFDKDTITCLPTGHKHRRGPRACFFGFAQNRLAAPAKNRHFFARRTRAKCISCRDNQAFLYPTAGQTHKNTRTAKPYGCLSIVSVFASGGGIGCMDACAHAARYANFIVAGAAGTPVGGNIARDGAECTLFHSFRHVPGDDLVVGLYGIHHFSKGGSARDGPSGCLCFCRYNNCCNHPSARFRHNRTRWPSHTWASGPRTTRPCCRWWCLSYRWNP